MATATLTLTDFLLARIAEDEAAGTAGEGWDVDGWDWDVPVQFWDYGETHIGYRRFLAECEAKRRIVTLMGYVRESWENKHAGEGRVMWPDVNRREKMHALTILENLALPYADHEDYREEWKP